MNKIIRSLYSMSVIMVRNIINNSDLVNSSITNSSITQSSSFSADHSTALWVGVTVFTLAVVGGLAYSKFTTYKMSRELNNTVPNNVDNVADNIQHSGMPEFNHSLDTIISSI